MNSFRNITSYDIDKVISSFMSSIKEGGKNNYNLEENLMKDDYIDEKYIMKEKEINKLLLEDITEFNKNFYNVIFNMYDNIGMLLERISENDKHFVDLYNQFKKAYDELFILAQIKEEDIDRYVDNNNGSANYLKNHMSNYRTLISNYCAKRTHKIFDKNIVKMHMILTFYDELSFTNFEKTQKLLELFYMDKAIELGIDFQLIRDIKNVLKDNEKRRNERILQSYEDQNGGEIDEDEFDSDKEYDENEES
jgi:hypothetical protein